MEPYYFIQSNNYPLTDLNNLKEACDPIHLKNARMQATIASQVFRASRAFVSSIPSRGSQHLALLQYLQGLGPASRLSHCLQFRKVFHCHGPKLVAGVAPLPEQCFADNESDVQVTGIGDQIYKSVAVGKHE